MQNIKGNLTKKKEKTNEFQCLIINGYCNVDGKRYTTVTVEIFTRKIEVYDNKIFDCGNELRYNVHQCA